MLATRPVGAAWVVMERINIDDAGDLRRTVNRALDGGATGVELALASDDATYRRILGGSVDLGGILTGLDIPIRIDAGEATTRLLATMTSAERHLASGFDAVTARAAGRLSGTVEDACAETAALIDAMDRDGCGGSAFASDGRPWHDAGASEVQELAIVVASAVVAIRMLMASGAEPERIAGRLGVTLSADADQFLTIAKFRAARLLFARLSEVTGLAALCPPVHGQTSWRMLARREPTMNLIRATTAAFAAAAGGADSITVLSPLLEGVGFGARMARNTQTILIAESTLHAASDPGAGSGAVEALTDELAAAAWALFARIEGEGGLVAAIDSGSLPREVAAMGEKRLDRVRRRQHPIVGVNVNVDPRSTALAPFPASSRDRGPLRPWRIAEPFEALCARSTDGDGNRRRVFLLSSQSGKAEDPTMAADAFAAGGFEIVPAAMGTKDEAVAAAFAASGASLACVIADRGQTENAVTAAARSRKAGAKMIVIAASSGDGIDADACDAVLSTDTDIVALMSEMLDRIAEQHQNGQS